MCSQDPQAHSASRYNDSHDYADDADVKYRRRDSRYD